MASDRFEITGLSFNRADGRIKTLLDKFTKVYGCKPDVVVRAPGRVNIIGEHIDYNGYAVLPLAITQDIMIAARIREGAAAIEVSNVNGSAYEQQSLDPRCEIDHSKPNWTNYVKAAVLGVREYFDAPICENDGVQMLFDGTIPPSAGLSSSSALVCATTLALSAVYERKLGVLARKGDGGKHTSAPQDTTFEGVLRSVSRSELAQQCARCERYVGTEGGGMDQAISMLAERGTAKFVEFAPLRTTNVRLPHTAVFAVANCRVEMNKAASSHFNQRVVECRLGAKALLVANGAQWPAVRDVRALRDAQLAYNATLSGMAPHVERVLKQEPYKVSELCALFNVDEPNFREQLLTPNTQQIEEFHLRKRAEHVFGEADRTCHFRDLCENDRDKPDILERLGSLMNESHHSCSKLYECSAPQLDELVDVCVRGGAYGSRLTGAGWGGCCVSLIDADRADAFLEFVRREFYLRKWPQLSTEELSNSLFITEPGDGARVYQIES